MTDDANAAHDVLYAATAARMAIELQKFQKALEGTLSRTAGADMLLGIAAGIYGLDAGAAAIDRDLTRTQAGGARRNAMRRLP